jgi:hypothetical protein
VKTLAIPQFLRVSTPQSDPNTLKKRYQIVTKTGGQSCLSVYTGAIFISMGNGSYRTDQKMMFLKVTNNRYVSFDGKFEIVKVGFGVWSVSKKNDNDKFFSLYFNYSFESASKAISELEKVVA